MLGFRMVTNVIAMILLEDTGSRTLMETAINHVMGTLNKCVVAGGRTLFMPHRIFRLMVIYANYMQIAHYACKYAKMCFWSNPAETDQKNIFAYLHI